MEQNSKLWQTESHAQPYRVATSGDGCAVPLADRIEMGFEYKTRFSVPTDGSIDRMLALLPDATIDDSSWTQFDVEVKSDGIYFLDNGRSDAAAIAFKQLIDEALKHSEKDSLLKRYSWVAAANNIGSLFLSPKSASVCTTAVLSLTSVRHVGQIRRGS